MENVFDKVKKFKEKIQVSFPRLTERECYLLLDHISRFQEGSRKELSFKEREFYDFLLRNQYKPRTVMNWLRVLKLPSHLREGIRSGKISVTKALKTYGQYRRRNDRELEEEIINDIRKYINKLTPREYIDEESENGPRN